MLPATLPALPEVAMHAPGSRDGAASETRTRDRDDARPANYEFAFVSVGAYQAWSVAGRCLYVGVGGGLGPALYRYGKMSGSGAGWSHVWEGIYAHPIVRIAPFPFLNLDIGPKIGLATSYYGVPDAPQGAFTYGGYADVRAGSRTVKVGPRIEYVKVAYGSFYETGWIVTPLMVRVAH